MTFLAPALVFGLAAAAAPVIIHLLNRRRFRRIPWAAMEFLAKVASVSKRRLRLEEILLMALRTLAVLLFALAFARPFLSAGAPAGSALDAVILVDKSASMQLSAAAGTLFDFATSSAREILDGLGAGARVSLIFFDSEADYPIGLEPTADLGAVRDALGAAKPGWAGTDFSAALSAAARAAKSFAAPPTVFIVSDFRQGAQYPAPGAQKGLEGQIYLVPVADSDGEDVGIAGISPAGALFTASAGAVSVKVSNSTPRNASVPLSLAVDGSAAETVPVAAAPDTVVASIADAPALKSTGTHRVEATVSPDAYPCDDHAFAAISRQPLRLAACASGEAETFLSAAFKAAGDGLSVLPVSPESVASAASAADAFVLAAPFPDDTAATEAIAAKIADGGFAVVFLDAANVKGAAGFLGAVGASSLAESLKSARPAEGAFSPVVSGSHAVTQFIRQNADLSLASVALTRAVDFRAPSGEGIETPLVVETPGGKSPFLAIARVGKGHVAVFNNSADRSSGNFVVSPFFVPLLFETLGALSTDETTGLNFFCGEPAAVPVEAGGAKAEVSGPSGPVRAALEPVQGGFAVVFTPEVPGFYEAGGRVVAANAPPSEANLRLAERTSLERQLGARVLNGGDDFRRAVERRTRGFELSMPLLAAAVLALAAEMVLVETFKRLS